MSNDIAPHNAFRALVNAIAEAVSKKFPRSGHIRAMVTPEMSGAITVELRDALNPERVLRFFTVIWEPDFGGNDQMKRWTVCVWKSMDAFYDANTVAEFNAAELAQHYNANWPNIIGDDVPSDLHTGALGAWVASVVDHAKDMPELA